MICVHPLKDPEEALIQILRQMVCLLFGSRHPWKLDDSRRENNLHLLIGISMEILFLSENPSCWSFVATEVIRHNADV